MISSLNTCKIIKNLITTISITTAILHLHLGTTKLSARTLKLAKFFENHAE